MATPTSDTIGGTTDVVKLVLGTSQEVHIAERYQVTSGIFTQPSAFTIELGSSDVVGDLLDAYPPNTPFKLYVNDALQFEGRTDKPGAKGNDKRSTFTLSGRDNLKDVHDSCIETEQDLQDKTPIEIVKLALDATGTPYTTIDQDNAASRKTRAGVPIITLSQKAISPPVRRRRARHLKAGETWFQAIRKDLKHSGLFLWSAPGQRFVLSAPDPNQKTLGTLYRKRQRDGTYAGNCETYDFENDTTHRYARYRVFGSIHFNGPGFAEGSFTDPEMVKWGFKKVRTLHDVDVTSPEEAQFFARRILAESRRAGFRLVYEVTGHTFTTNDGRSRAVWTPDTMIDVDDDELHIHQPMWVEEVLFEQNGQSGTRTFVRLLWPDALVFGGED
jgi:prophage tail gpP-like protein